MPPKGILAAIRRELDAYFQEQNELFEYMIRKLEALINQTPTLPGTTDIIIVEDEEPAPRKPVL